MKQILITVAILCFISGIAAGQQTGGGQGSSGGGGGTTTNALTLNNSNSGAASGATFNGGASVTASANTFGAPSLVNNNTFTGTNTFATTSAVAQFVKMLNSTAATVSTPQSSPHFSVCGREWVGAGADGEGCLDIQFVPAAGLNAGGTFAFTHTGTGSGAYGTTFPGSISAGSSPNAGYLALPGNTANSSVTSNSAGFMGPASASFTAYALQLPSTAPSGTQYLGCGTPSSGVSTCTFNTVSGSGAPSTLTQVTKTANYTLVSGDFQSTAGTATEVINFTISSSTVVTATLPASAPALVSSQMPCVWLENSANSMPFELQINTNSLTLDGTAYGANKIGVDPGKAVLICSNGTNYVVAGGQLSVFVSGVPTLGNGGGAGTGNCVMAAGGPTANHIAVWSNWNFPQATVISNVAYNQGVADAGNAEDIGILYGAPGTTGTLVAHTGSTTNATTGNKFTALTATVVLPPGNYYPVTTTAGTTAAIGCASAAGTYENLSTNNSATTATSGVMPASIAVPSAGGSAINAISMFVY